MRQFHDAHITALTRPRRQSKKSDVAFVALVARLKKESANPQLTKSVRETATKKQIASWNAD